MAQRIDIPGLGVVEFPDGMSDADIADAIKRNAPQTETPSVAADVAKSGGIGLAKGGIQLLGLPGDARGLASKATDFIGNALGASPETVGGIKNAASLAMQSIPGMGVFATGPTSEKIQKTVEGVTGDFYKPKTTAGHYAETIGEFLPAAAAGPGSLARRIGMQAVIPAVGSEAAGQLTQGTAAEPYARVAGALLSPIAASKIGPIGADVLGGVFTNTGGSPVKTAFSSGFKGGEAGQAFRDNMRGNVPIDEVVTDAKTALRNMRADRGKEYEAGMKGIRSDPAVLDFTDIDAAVAKANNVKTFKGRDLSKSTAEVRQNIQKEIDDWRALDPKEYHTPAGLDALKQTIGDIKDALPFNTPQRAVADQVYNSIRQTIVKQAPDYAKTMKGYETASKEIGEIEKTLSLNPKASVDTSLRKLQSATRNNVNTNYGKRADLAETLAQNGAPDLMEKLSGQAMNAWSPRGLGKVSAPLAAASSWFNPAALAILPLMSPRLVGEVAHAAGRAAKLPSEAENAVRGLLNLAPTGGLLSGIEKKRANLIAAINAAQGAH